LTKRIGIIYNPKIAQAKALSEQLLQVLPPLNASAWLCSAYEEEELRAQALGTDLALSVGGDGTLLRVARAMVPWGTPILGVNLGRLGFMTELRAEEVVDKLPAFLAGEGWIEERAMLQVELFPVSKGSSSSFHALNDIMVGRGTISRVVDVKALIDGEPLITYRVDGIIVSTATGSTGYNLAAGGPILYPQAKEVVLKPVSAYLSPAYALVLPSTIVIELEVYTDHQATLSIDGQIGLALQDRDKVRVKLSPHLARLWRIHPPTYFYSTLEQKLRR
jgi:NAD+ kinase